MKTSMTRGLLALSTVVWLTSGIVADELRFSEFENRLSAIEGRLAEKEGVRTASYFSDHGNNGGCDCAKSSCGCDQCCPSVCCCEPCGFWYAELQALWLRVHIMDDMVGKLSERHYFAPRFVLGYEDGCGVGARARYFHWGNSVRNLDQGGSERFDWDVLDLELTGRVKWARTDVLFAGGFRYARLELFDQLDANFYGLTFASDARTLISTQWGGALSAVAGARISVLGGDWNDGNVASDDNMLVRELYVGAEYRFYYSGYDMFTRVTYEIQNWHSDFIAQNTGTDSLGLVGPGVHIGANF